MVMTWRYIGCSENDLDVDNVQGIRWRDGGGGQNMGPAGTACSGLIAGSVESVKPGRGSKPPGPPPQCPHTQPHLFPTYHHTQATSERYQPVAQADGLISNPASHPTHVGRCCAIFRKETSFRTLHFVGDSLAVLKFSRAFEISQPRGSSVFTHHHSRRRDVCVSGPTYGPSLSPLPLSPNKAVQYSAKPSDAYLGTLMQEPLLPAYRWTGPWPPPRGHGSC